MKCMEIKATDSEKVFTNIKKTINIYGFKFGIHRPHIGNGKFSNEYWTISEYLSGCSVTTKTHKTIKEAELFLKDIMERKQEKKLQI